MTTFFVSRHPGAADWAREQGLAADRAVALPVNLAAEVCARGGRYLHLSLDLPADWRGRELNAADMRACGARLEEYRVQRVA